VALSEDQRALLRLLLAGDTYEQVADVLGTSPEEVERRAREAATELERDPDPDLSSPEVYARLESLEGGAPAAASAGPPSAGPPSAGAGSRLPQRWALWAAGVAAAIIVVAVVLVVAGGGDGGGGKTTSAGSLDREDVVPIELSPVGGADARGTIAVVRTSGDQPAVDLAIRGLPPSARDETYVLWFVGSGGRSLPVAFRAVGSDGRLTGRAAIPTAAASLLPSFETAELTLAGQLQAAGAVRRAAQSGTLPQPVGTVVLRGALR
jgi:hypothetical protein